MCARDWIENCASAFVPPDILLCVYNASFRGCREIPTILIAKKSSFNYICILFIFYKPRCRRIYNAYFTTQ